MPIYLYMEGMKEEREEGRKEGQKGRKLKE
jgi:hypothetical protein